MNKLEANFVLLSVTFFWGIQYMFLKNIPDDVSTFAFLAVTNVIGFVLVTAVFFGELLRITWKLAQKSLILAVLLFCFNVFLTMGTKMVEPSTASFLAASYIVFIPIIMAVLGRKISKNSAAGILAVLSGIFLAAGVSLKGQGAGWVADRKSGDLFETPDGQQILVGRACDCGIYQGIHHGDAGLCAALCDGSQRLPRIFP